MNEYDKNADTHEVFNQPPALQDYNAYDTDTALRERVYRHGAQWADAELSAYGALTGSAEVNGVTEEFSTARFYREAPINAIWEGSGNVQALDMLRALGKNPAVLEAWFAELDKSRGAGKRFDRAVDRLKNEFADKSDFEYRARQVVDQMALTMQAHLLVKAGNSVVADGFIDSRLEGYGDRNYGTLPVGTDFKAIIHRGNPLVK